MYNRLTICKLATNAGVQGANTIRFTGRVHMSGYTKPLEHLGDEDRGVGNWMLYDDSIFTTWPCKENRQWFIGVKVRYSKAFLLYQGLNLVVSVPRNLQIPIARCGRVRRRRL